MMKQSLVAASSAARRFSAFAIWAGILAIVLALTCNGANVHGQTPSKDPIRLPRITPEMAPAPMPVVADQAVKLTPDVIYVVESDVECLLFLSPGGAVKFTKESGPLKFRGKFADGTGAVETRTFAGKYLYLFDAVRDGRDELIIVPVGAKAETDARRVTFQVGQLPQPPPVVDPVKPTLTAFQQTIQSSIKADAATVDQVKLYAALWRQAATTTVNDTTITTGAAMLAELQQAVKLLGLPPGSLAKTARAVADELNQTLAKTGKLDAANRATISALFARVANDLETAGGAK